MKLAFVSRICSFSGMGLSVQLSKRGAGISKHFATISSAENIESAAVRAAEDACLRAKEFGFNEFEGWLTSGGDDRSLILKSGANKYHIKPRPISAEDVFRGSCTGNPPTVRGYDAAKELYEDKFKNEKDSGELGRILSQTFEDQQSRISRLLNLPEGSGVVICPSGSDAEYIPVAIAKSLARSGVTIRNGVTQLNEIGAGSAPASIGQFFSTHAPLLGELSPDAKVLEGFEGIEGPVIPARSRDGEVLNAAQEMKDFLESSLQDGTTYPIVHGVFGGKTGVRDETMPPSLENGKKSMGVVDACQGRFTLEELHQWLNQDSLVLFTCSKFYQAPPFCGCVIIPPSIAALLKDSPPPTQMLSVYGLGGFLTDKELPSCLESWKPHLKKEKANNIGLALRLEAGLAGMEALQSTNDDTRNKAVQEWANSLQEKLIQESSLDPWAIQRSIISIRVAHPQGGWLNMAQARDLYRWMSMDLSHLLNNKATEDEMYFLKKPTYIGQPVDVSETHAIVRIALGVESLLSFLENKESTLQEDEYAIKKLALISKYFIELKQTGK